MKEIEIKAYAKINLSLDILGVMENGYHEVETVMQQLRLHDLVRVQSEGRNSRISMAEIVITANREAVPGGSENIAYRAAELLLAYIGEKARETEQTNCEAPEQDDSKEKTDGSSRKPGKGGQTEESAKIHIHIEKNIPIAAGLAGGSSNAAAVILALNHLLELKLGLDELCKIGGKLGADVPFCIMGQAYGNPHLGEQINKHKLASPCAAAKGIGDELTPVKGLDCYILLSKPDIGISTAEVYKGMDAEMGWMTENGKNLVASRENHIDTKTLIEGIEEKDCNKILPNMVNLLELFTLKRYPIVMYTKNMMKQSGNPLKVLMSGSGPTIFGVYKDEEEMEKSYRICRNENKETFLTHTLI